MKVLINKDGSKELWPTTENDVKLMEILLTTGSTVTWTYMQDLRKTNQLGGGVYFKSETSPPKGVLQPVAIQQDEDVDKFIESIHEQVGAIKKKRGKKNAK